MEIYIFLLLWSLVTGSIFLKKRNVNNLIYILLNFIPLALVSGLRARCVGTDTNMYHVVFYEVADNSFVWSFFDDRGIEIGFRALLKIISVFSYDSNISIFTISIILTGLCCRFIYKYSPNVFLSMFLFIGLMYFCETMNTVRQSLACMIICNSYIYLVENKLKTWIICVLLASMFHFSALLFLVFSILNKVTLKRIIIVVLPSIVGIVVLHEIVNNTPEFIFMFKYCEYFIHNNVNTSGGDILRIFTYAVIIFLGYKTYYKFNEFEKIMLLFYVFLFLCFDMQCC